MWVDPLKAVNFVHHVEQSVREFGFPLTVLGSDEGPPKLSILFAALVFDEPGRLIDQGNNPELGGRPDNDLRLPGEKLLRRQKLLAPLDERIANLDQNGRFVPV